MHAFDANGSVVILFDAFGINTIELTTGKVRCEKATSGQWFSANGGVGLFHSERANNRVARTLPGLTQTTVSKGYDLKYQRVAVLADGKRALLPGDDALKLYVIASGKESTVPLPPGQKLKPVSFGPRLDPWVGEHEREVFVGADDSFAFFSGDGTARGGVLTRKANGAAGGDSPRGPGIDAAWSMKCGFPQGVLRVRPHKSGTFLSAWHPALNRSFCALITPKGVVTREVDTISPAVFSGTHLVFQPSAANVMREHFDGSGAEAFALPGEAQGPGELMSEGDAVLFVTPDRESVLELTGARRTFDRRLGTTTAAERPAFRALSARFNALARVANQVITLDCVHLPQYGRGVRPHFSFGHGDLGFLRLCVSAWVVTSLRRERGGAWSLGSYSNPTTIRPIDAEELLRDFAAIDATPDFDFVESLGFLESPLHECFGGSFSRDKKVKVKEPMKKDAEHLLLWAVIESLASKQRVPLAKSAPKWSKQKLTPQLFIKKLDPRDEREAWGEAQTAVAWLVLDYFGADALPIFIDWFAERPGGMVQNNAHIIGDVPRRMLTQWPETKKPFVAALEAASKKAKDEDLRRALDNFRDDL